jgi:ribulose-bisphosphate carboxylase large chain
MIEDPIEAVYRVRSTPADVGARAEALLLEQTVELPRTALKSAFVRDRLVGTVLAIDEVGPGDFRVRLAQPAVAAASDPAQLLNILFGNCSLQPDVELEDLRLPGPLVAALGGPRHGIAGLRRLAGVTGRALTASVIKPIGLTVPEMAALCANLALGGLDLIKDDHGLADHAFCPFTERVRACLGAVGDAAQSTGRQTLYVPNLVGTPATVARQAREARELGVRAVMVSPMLLGLPFLNELVRDLGMPVLAHPAFGGALRIGPAPLLGKLFPLYGADAVIFPNAGGRFSFSAETCSAIAAALRNPAAAIAPAMPVPAGGIQVGSLPSVLERYGADAILLVGGSLLDAPDAPTLLSRTRAFVATVKAHFKP